jgi:hypothetical protein
VDTSLIFQRTHTGRAEIHEKRHGLTQSERLVLIMIDGITSYGDVRKKLPVLNTERFARAFNRLIKKDLIIEIFLPVTDQTAETVERTVIDRFLQQDPLDPVTIIVHDIEEELGEATLPRHDATTKASAILPVDREASLRTEISGEESGAHSAPAAQAAMDEHHIALADSLTSELQDRRIQSWRQAAKPTREHSKSTLIRRLKSTQVKTSTTWPYWSIGIGISFIAGFVAARLPF